MHLSTHISRHLKHPHVLSSGPNVESRRVAQFHHRRFHLAILTCFMPHSSCLISSQVEEKYYTSEEDPHAIHVGVEPLLQVLQVLQASTAVPAFISSIWLRVSRQAASCFVQFIRPVIQKPPSRMELVVDITLVQLG